MSNKYFEATVNYFYKRLDKFNLFDAWPELGLLAYVDEEDTPHIVFVTEQWLDDIPVAWTDDALGCSEIQEWIDTAVEEDCKVLFDMIGFKIIGDRRALLRHAINVPVFKAHR